MDHIRGDWVLHHGVAGVRHIGWLCVPHVKVVHSKVFLKFFHLIRIYFLTFPHVVIYRFCGLTVQRQEVKVRILTLTDGEVRLVVHWLHQGRLFAAAVLLFRKLASLHVFGSW